MKVSAVKSNDEKIKKKKMKKNKRQRKIQTLSKGMKVEKNKKRIKLHELKFAKPKSDVNSVDDGKNKKIKKSKKPSKFRRPEVKKFENECSKSENKLELTKSLDSETSASNEEIKKGKKRKIPSTNDNWEKLKAEIHEETVRLLPPQFKFVRTEQAESGILKNQSSTSKNNEEVWFDGVDPTLLGENENVSPEICDSDRNTKLVTDSTDKSITAAVGMDCEMVGVGLNGFESMLARVSIVNHFGNVLYDKYAKPQEKVVDYRTEFSGIRPEDLVKGLPFPTIQKEVSEIVKGRLLVGHDLFNDLQCLFLSHPKEMRRDTAKYKPFRNLNGGGKPSLKKLARLLLSMEIQSGEHDSIVDARAAMRMYTLNKKEWEAFIKNNKGGYKKGEKHRKTEEESPLLESKN